MGANFPLKSGGAMVGGGLALLVIEVTIGVVAEHCGELTIPTVYHFPLINAGWLAGVVLEWCLRTAFLRCRTAP